VLLHAAEIKYRALLTDINLGRDKLTGWDVARHAREIDLTFPVVYLSGDSAEQWAVQGVPNSIMLSKPFAPAQIVTAIVGAPPPILKDTPTGRRSLSSIWGAKEN
jgi:DNA-binding response OmpR family regulator